MYVVLLSLSFIVVILSPSFVTCWYIVLFCWTNSTSLFVRSSVSMGNTSPLGVSSSFTSYFAIIVEEFFIFRELLTDRIVFLSSIGYMCPLEQTKAHTGCFEFLSSGKW